MVRHLIWLAFFLLLPFDAYAAVLSPSEAATDVGQNGTVCGIVASAHYAPRSRGQPTFLDLGHAYPNEDFTAVIWGDDRPKFGRPEDLQGQRICVSGPITTYRGKPQIIVHDTSQLRR